MARYLPQQYCRRSRRRPYIGIVGFYVEIVFFVAVGIIRGVKYWSMYKDITHFCIDRNANSRYSPGSFPYNLSHKKYELFIELSSLLISKSSQSYVGIVCIYIVTRFTYLLYHTRHFCRATLCSLYVSPVFAEQSLCSLYVSPTSATRSFELITYSNDTGPTAACNDHYHRAGKHI